MADTFQPPTTELIEALHGVLRQVAEPTQVLRIILEQAVARTGAERGLFVEVAEAGALEYRVLHGFRPQQLEGDGDQFSRSLFARVLETGKEVLLQSVAERFRRFIMSPPREVRMRRPGGRERPGAA